MHTREQKEEEIPRQRFFPFIPLLSFEFSPRDVCVLRSDSSSSRSITEKVVGCGWEEETTAAAAKATTTTLCVHVEHVLYISLDAAHRERRH
jgi:hypothetical protein